MEGSSALSDSEALIRTLDSRGWCFGDVEQIKALILLQFSLHGDSCSANTIEHELANMDLGSIGGKSLPDPSLLSKSSHLPGPKVLQISSVRDISRSTIADGSGNSCSRLLRLNLTDGHSEIKAIEYSHIPSLPKDVVPGMKVRLDNKATVHDGIVCLVPENVSVLGGFVQSLYEEWQMNQKYSACSRSSLKISKESDIGGPPPFEKLQIRASSNAERRGKSSYCAGSTSQSSGDTILVKHEKFEPKQIGGCQESEAKVDVRDNDVKSAFSTERTEGKPNNFEARPKEVVESMPVQNQAAAQKLLQKMSQPNQNVRHSRRSYRGKGKHEESPVFTLDEWERRKTGVNASTRDELPKTSQDEDLAWQLQNQFDLEDLHVKRGPHDSKAEDIKISMFNFERDGMNVHEMGGFRGRGKGRGKGRRGRGRF